VVVGQGDDLLPGENAVKFNRVMLVGAVIQYLTGDGMDAGGADMAVRPVQLGIELKLHNAHPFLEKTEIKLQFSVFSVYNP